MRRITGQVAYCRHRAAVCRQKASRETSDQARVEYRAMAQHWASLAESYQLAENVSGFIQWNAQRIEPPEAFDA